MSEYRNSIIMKYNTDGNGNLNPIKINNETKQVSPTHYFIQLDQFPDEYMRVKIDEMYEVFDVEEIDNVNKFKVDYKNGKIFFHPTKSNSNIIIKEYFGIGYEVIGAERIGTELGDGNQVITTLRDDIVEIKSKVEEYDTIYNNKVTEFTNIINTEISEMNSTVTDKIAEVDLNIANINNTVDTKMGSVENEMVTHRNTLNQLHDDYVNATQYNALNEVNGTVIISSNTTTFTLDVLVLNPLIDVVYLYYQGVKLLRNVHYTQTERTFDFTWTLLTGEEINYEILKGVRHPM